MKLKATLLALSSLVIGTASSNAASMIVSNLAGGPGDTLYASSAGVPMSTGLVTMGYFISTISESQIDTIPELLSVLATPSNYITVTSAVPGAVGSGIGDGFANQLDFTSIGSVTIGNALLGRTIYSIVTDAASLASATLTNEFALVNLGPIKDDVPDVNQYTSNPANQAWVIGELGSFDGDPGTGPSVYPTLNMEAVPEPSAALLGALGALGLLRRRRN